MSSFDDNYGSVSRASIIKIENLTRKCNGVVKENSRLKNPSLGFSTMNLSY